MTTFAVTSSSYSVSPSLYFTADKINLSQKSESTTNKLTRGTLFHYICSVMGAYLCNLLLHNNWLD